MIESHLQREQSIKNCVRVKTDYLESIMTHGDADRSAEVRREHNLVIDIVAF